MITVALDVATVVICVKRFAHVSPRAKEAFERLEEIRDRLMKIARVRADFASTVSQDHLPVSRMQQIARAFLLRAVTDLEGSVSRTLFQEAMDLLEAGIECIDTVAEEAIPDGSINARGGAA